MTQPDAVADVDFAEGERLRCVIAGMDAYIQLLEGALLAAWNAGEPARRQLSERPDESLTVEERNVLKGWELVGEIVQRVPAHS